MTAAEVLREAAEDADEWNIAPIDCIHARDNERGAEEAEKIFDRLFPSFLWAAHWQDDWDAEHNARIIALLLAAEIAEEEAGK